MKKFYKGTAICQFNVDVTVEANNPQKAEKKIDEFLDKHNDIFDVKVTLLGKQVHLTLDECFEVIDVKEVK